MNRGPFIITASGNQFSYWPVEQERIHIEDIARALSNICRFNGHLEEGIFYSVAQHSCIVAQIVSRQLIDMFGPQTHEEPDTIKIIQAALLHDATEAYMADLVSPIKKGYNPQYVREDKPHPFLVEGVRLYREYEQYLYSQIAQKFGVPEETPPIVHEVDSEVVLGLEWMALKSNMITERMAGLIISPKVKKYEDMQWEIWSRETAEHNFLENWHSLEGQLEMLEMVEKAMDED